MVDFLPEISEENETLQVIAESSVAACGSVSDIAFAAKVEFDTEDDDEEEDEEEVEEYNDGGDNDDDLVDDDDDDDDDVDDRFDEKLEASGNVEIFSDPFAWSMLLLGGFNFEAFAVATALSNNSFGIFILKM